MVRIVVMVILLIMITSVYAIAAFIKDKGGGKMTKVGWVHMHTISEQVLVTNL